MPLGRPSCVLIHGVRTADLHFPAGLADLGHQSQVLIHLPPPFGLGASWEVQQPPRYIVVIRLALPEAGEVLFRLERMR